jgi:threonine aldolase
VEQSAHLYTTEFGGIAAACGLLVMPVAGRRGAIVPEALQDAVRRASAGFPARGLLCLENTHNAAGGTAIAPAHLDRCADIARAHGLAVHLDGARLFNAAVALHVTPSDIARAADSVSVCLSKGLSAPVGSLLAGSDQFVARARRVRRMFGGAMRQAGIIAAPGLVALRTMVSRLTEDHAHAAALGHALARIAGLTIDLESVQTNMVLVDVSRLGIDASTFARHLDPRGVRGLPGMGSTIRFVTYRGITRADVDDVARIVAETVAAAPWLSETVNV